MGAGPDPRLRLTGPPVPLEGLAAASTLWGNRAQVWSAIAAAASLDSLTDAWTASAARRRGDRVAYTYLVERLQTVDWPRSATPWRQALPAETARDLVVASYPPLPVDWIATRRLGPWPPTTYVGRPRRRIPATLLASTLRWTLDRIAGLRGALGGRDPAALGEEPVGLIAALALRDQAPLDEVRGAAPRSQDLRAVAREGWPWTALASVAAELIRQDRLDPHALAREMLLPDAELRGAAFHLAVFGEVLLAARDAGLTDVSLRPIGIGTGPVHRLHDGPRTWELWFDAGGLAGTYGGQSPYRLAAAKLSDRPVPLRPDIALVDPATRECRAFECKHSTDRDYLGTGLVETLAYLPELHGALGRAPAASLVVPEGASTRQHPWSARDGTVAVEPADLVRPSVTSYLSRSRAGSASATR